MESPRSKLPFLENIPLFRGLGDEDLIALASIMDDAHPDTGKVLFKEGELAEHLYIVVSGRIQILKRVAGDAERLVGIAVLTAPEVLGEMALVMDGRRSCTAAALEPSVMIVMSKVKLAQLCADNPRLWAKLAANIAQILAGRLARMNELVSDQLSDREPDSLIARLLRLAQ